MKYTKGDNWGLVGFDKALSEEDISYVKEHIKTLSSKEVTWNIPDGAFLYLSISYKFSLYVRDFITSQRRLRRSLRLSVLPPLLSEPYLFPSGMKEEVAEVVGAVGVAEVAEVAVAEVVEAVEVIVVVMAAVVAEEAVIMIARGQMILKKRLGLERVLERRESALLSLTAALIQESEAQVFQSSSQRRSRKQTATRNCKFELALDCVYSSGPKK